MQEALEEVDHQVLLQEVVGLQEVKELIQYFQQSLLLEVEVEENLERIQEQLQMVVFQVVPVVVEEDIIVILMED